LAVFRLDENIEHPLAASNGMTAKIRSQYLIGGSGWDLRSMMVAVISTMIPAMVSTLIMSATTIMTTTAGNQYTSTSDKQGDDGQHKQQIFHI
jgi:hypothetical protein